MRKIRSNAGDGWFDHRLIEVAAVIVVTVLIAAGVRYLDRPPAPGAQASFIVPSQTVRW
jgi:hypothetical protein